MRKYVIQFSKKGYIKYISHLDMLRLFKRAFKKTGIAMAYSQGFNPHPKMGFAQPLSLGYTSCCEYLEIETAEEWQPEEIGKRIGAVMPEGIEIISCKPFTEDVKSLAAATIAATYEVTFPVQKSEKNFSEILKNYLNQKEILAEKRQKKTKKMVTVDIRFKIRKIDILPEEQLTLSMDLDCGSSSNLSPEQVIASFCSFAELDVPRYDIEVLRKTLCFNKF